jgi:hypothetical protein
MRWAEVRAIYPEQWLVIEALEAYSENDERILERISVVETCADGSAAMQRYRQLHQEYPLKEIYFVHTSRKALDIGERRSHRDIFSRRYRRTAQRPSGRVMV